MPLVTVFSFSLTLAGRAAAAGDLNPPPQVHGDKATKRFKTFLAQPIIVDGWPFPRLQNFE